MSKKNFDALIDVNTHTNEDAAIKSIITTDEAEKTKDVSGLVVEHVNTPIIKPNLLSSEDVERITGLSDKTTAKYLREGKIKAVKHGTKWVINPEDLNNYLAGKFDFEWIEHCKAAEAARKARRKPRTPKAVAVEA